MLASRFPVSAATVSAKSLCRRWSYGRHGDAGNLAHRLGAAARLAGSAADTSTIEAHLGILVDGRRHHTSDDDISRTMVLTCSIVCAASAAAELGRPGDGAS